MKRRTFLASGSGLFGATVAPPPVASGERRYPAVDFRHAPQVGQASFCFPDDPHKSLVGEKGDLRYGFDSRRGILHFPCVVEFSLRGGETDRVVAQRLESPGVPIIHTRIDRPQAFLELTAFATNRAGEGRVDNVIFELRPKSKPTLYAGPIVLLKTRRTVLLRNSGGTAAASPEKESEPPVMIADRPLKSTDVGDGYLYEAPEEPAHGDRPLRCFFRFPQQGQSAAQLETGLREPEALLAEARAYWKNWSPFQNGVVWHLPSMYQNFLVACTRNILQARERVDDRLTFQVGPTWYRSLWIVDGNFILEAARYLGYDEEVRQGLDTTWSKQQSDGSVVAAVKTAHWKDTGIAMFTMVRQAELSQDWAYVRQMQSNLLRGAGFLRDIRDKARQEGSANGRYGLLARGFGDGGIGGGVRDEFTNTVWALAGLRATTEAADRLELTGFADAKQFYRELRDSFFDCARRQMRRHSGGFEYLPMLLKEDPGWENADPWKRPRPQTGQWALAHSIFPGLVFEKSDPIVKGYLALMQASTQEDVPSETGWLPHGGLWGYDAAFASHVYLWAGLQERAMSTFTGFLNHATPLYCWREEQPLKGALVGHFHGDMPHNWASAECVLFLRHMLALEDGPALRLLQGITGEELAAGEPYEVRHSPTRFGRISVHLEPIDRLRGWRLKFERGRGPAPTALQIPESLGALPFDGVRGAKFTRTAEKILIEPEGASWEATWRKG
ncbi:MAG: hypothetical protein ABSH05_26460 [Bryobacteraceae bacterium]|jgi:hypothetical protein